MHDFCYVSKREAAPIKAELIDLIHRVQDYVRDDFTFQYYFVGSSSRNMITYDRKSNVGFDFDVIKMQCSYFVQQRHQKEKHT